MDSEIEKAAKNAVKDAVMAKVDQVFGRVAAQVQESAQRAEKNLSDNFHALRAGLEKIS